MTVSILLMTHNELGVALINTATKTLGQLPLSIQAIAVDYTCDPDKLLPELQHRAKQLDAGDGVLILTDIFGATPNNLARKLEDNDHIQVIAGLNLPMLIRVMNYPDLTLAQLAQKAMSGGRDGVCCAEIPVTNT